MKKIRMMLAFNMDKDIKTKYNKQRILLIFLIFIYSIAFMKFVSMSEEPFLQDDNGLQWNPVIESAFHTFFTTGHLPQYDFYQLKGFDIVQVGYYGLSNPLMYISYLIGVLFSANTLYIYAVISYVLGNLIVYWFCSKRGYDTVVSLIIMFLYSTSSVFFFYSYWYYAFENYWLIPLLFFLFLDNDLTDRKREYFQYGILLAVSVYLGNIQYTMYHWIICAIVMLVIFIAYDNRYWTKIISNYATAFLFSAPALLGLAKASARSELYSGKNEAFFWDPLTITQYINECFSTRGINPFLLVMFMIGVVLLVRSFFLRKKVKYEQIVLLASVIVFCFFVLYMGGNNYFLAKYLYMIPGLNSCRYLFKILIILPGCLLPAAIYAIKRLTDKKKWNLFLYFTAAVCYVGSVYTCMQAYEQPFEGEFGGNKALTCNYEIKENVERLQFDMNNYRYMNLISGMSTSDAYDAYYTETHNINSLLVGNLGTKFSWFSLGGYDNTYSANSFSDIRNLFRDNFDYWTGEFESEMYSVRNTLSIKTLVRNIYAQGDYNDKVRKKLKELYPESEIINTQYQYDEFGICRSVFASLKKNEIVTQVMLELEEMGLMERSREVFDTLERNGVRYLLYDASNQGYVDILLDECRKLGINYCVGDITASCKYIELLNAGSLVSNDSNELVPIASSMDCLSFQVFEKDRAFSIAMSYSPNLHAKFYSEKGNVYSIELKENETGNIYLEMDEEENGGIKLYYSNGLNVIIVLFSWILFLCVATLFVFAVLHFSLHYHKGILYIGRENEKS